MAKFVGNSCRLKNCGLALLGIVGFVCLLSFARLTVSAFIFSDEKPPAAETEDEEIKIPAKTIVRGDSNRQILVFGGNGFIGAAAVEKLIELGDHVTIVNRGNWYWDSADRIVPYVKTISCDRMNGVASCADLVALISDVEAFDAVIDFSAYGPKDTRESTALLRGKAALYIHISTDSIYDVCNSDGVRSGATLEEEAVRPADDYLREMLSSHHEYGHRKMQAEEELVGQRVNASKDGSTGIPYVILRLPDVLGPRDTTYRFWLYQLWLRMTPVLPDRPVSMPKFLDGYNNSFVFVDDVARTIVDVLAAAAAVVPGEKAAFIDEAFNLAWPQNITLERLLRDIEAALGGQTELEFVKDDAAENLYLYPTVRRGPIDVTKAVKTLNFTATPWTKAINDTVAFYESAMTDPRFRIQRDEIIQVEISQLYSEVREKFLEAVEKIYSVDLTHFKPRREEL